MDDIFIVEQIHKNEVIIHEAARDERIRKVVDGHRVVTQIKLFIDVKFVLKDLSHRPCRLAKSSKIKFAVI
jgi:hypothetical protein